MNSDQINWKQHDTSTESNSGAPVCDGHHHGDRPPARKQNEEGSVTVWMTRKM